MSFSSADSLIQQALRGTLPDDATTTVPITSVLPADSPRLSGEDMEHARSLAEADQELPPIIIHQATMRVIDGMHRLRAAQLRGQTEIKAKFFHGPESDAFLLAVEANIRHGLPLTLADKTAAAQRLIRSHPHWSDRAIASATALSATKVGGLRNEASTGEQLTARLGQDGKIRPVSTEEGRRIAGRLLSETPYAPLREIARKAGISPGTVRDVRARVLRGEDPVPLSIRTPGKRRKPEPKTEEYGRAAARGSDGPETAADLDTLFQNLCRDPSLRQSELGRLLLRMLDVQLTGARRSSTIADAIPEHRLEMVSLAATECARSWQAFAERLELRRVRD